MNYASATWNIFRLLRRGDVILLCTPWLHLSNEIMALWKCENSNPGHFNHTRVYLEVRAFVCTTVLLHIFASEIDVASKDRD